MDQAKLDKLVANREKAMAGGGEAAVEKHHAKGSYTCRERINMLLDEGSFEEVNMFLTHRCHDFGMEKKVFLGDGVAVGSGTIDGRLVFVFAQDATVIGGSLSETMALKICNVMDQAMKLGAPIIGLNDSGGARIQEGACALAGYAEIFERNILASGVVPQISVIFGPCAGGAVYSPALTDFIMMTEQNSYMFITGPKVVKSVTGEDVTVEQLGGAHIHATKSGVTHFVAATEEEALAEVRRLVSFIPQNNMEEAPLVECTDDITRVDDNLNDIVPADPNKPYDMHEIINTIVGFCAGTTFVYPSVVEAKSMGICNPDMKIITGGFDNDPDLMADCGDDKNIIRLTTAAFESIIWPMALIDAAISGTMYKDYPGVERLDSGIMVINSTDKFNAVINNSPMGATSDEDRLAKAQASWDDMKDYFASVNPDASYKALTEFCQSFTVEGYMK